jgi:hypothetical protein
MAIKDRNAALPPVVVRTFNGCSLECAALPFTLNFPGGHTIFGAALCAR